ncbi:MAG: glycosyltransferase family 2 protein [Paludibacter sp.]|nr:glycosyltransferase family 2 protein [Paludibacter sp.]
MQTPKLICLTPVRNEAWILDAFLTATSLWADYIIIADQNSTDGSREIYKKYPKVTVIANNLPKMQMSHTRRLLFDAANKIEGDKIIFALDADEFFMGNFLQTDGWEKIINSKKNDVFEFKWLNLYGSLFTAIPEDERIAHGDWVCNYGKKISGDYPDNYIHEPRLMYPKNSNYIVISDLKVIHFARFNILRQQNKEKFYQISTVFNDEKKSAISLHRMYWKNEETTATINIESNIYDFYKNNGVDFEKLILKDNGNYYFIEIAQIFDNKGIKFFRKLDIWDKIWLAQLSEIAGKEIKDPRNLFDKLVHFYLRRTQKIKRNIFIKIIDKFLKKIYR